MLCRLIQDQPASGVWNMSVDESLLATAADEDSCALRIYSWEEPTLSLGYFQEYEDRRLHAASTRCPCVRRASGGGAIMHDREFTYCFAVPPTSRWAKNHLELYGIFHTALIEVLAKRGFPALLCPGAGSERGHVQPFLCFERRSSGDVLVGDAKVAGSAQRRSRGAVVQHGSILIDRSPAAPELPGLNDLGLGVWTAKDLIDAWLAKLVEKTHFTFQLGVLSDLERQRAVELVAKKYGTDSWNRHRGRDVIEKSE